MLEQSETVELPVFCDRTLAVVLSLVLGFAISMEWSILFPVKLESTL